MSILHAIHWRNVVIVAALIGLMPGTAPVESLAQTTNAALSTQPLYPGAETIRGILVLPQAEDVQPAGVTGISGVVIKGPDFLRRADFEKLLTAHLGRPLSEASLSQMQVEIIQYCRGRGHLVVDVFLREQDIVEGTIQLAVIEAKVGNVTVKNDGHKWFSDELVLREVPVKSGDVIIEQRLSSGLNWLNRNTYQSLSYFNAPFRETTATFQQGKLGETDLDINVKDRFPLRAFVGYEDSGTDVIGTDRFFAGFNWANVFGVDQRMNYQFITDYDFDKYHAHVGSYVVPLPWRHELIFFGAYADFKPDYSVFGDPALSTLQGDGTMYQLSARYNVPLRPFHKLEHEFAFGFDFKRTDSPLLFSGSTAGGLLQTNLIDVAQFTVDYRGLLKDRWGRTAFSIQGFYSPGELTEYNNTASFNDASPGSDAEYIYGRAELRRETFLPWGLSWYFRAAGQYADSQMVPSETFGVGGYYTVRGYDERTVAGDDGWLFVNELRSPRLALGNLTNKDGAVDWAQLLVFCDYGGVITRNPNPAMFERYGEILWSVGVGVRYEMADNIRVRVDYGYQLAREYLTSPNQLIEQPHGRIHVGVEASF